MKTIRFYSHKRGPFAAFSNFFESPLLLDGHWWPTVEHYFQAQKFADSANQKRIRRAASPAEAKRLGRGLSGLRKDWDNARLDVMRTGLRAKFTDHKLRALLLSTGDVHLIEAAPDDYFWGEGRDESGENWLGRLLVELRGSLSQRA